MKKLLIAVLFLILPFAYAQFQGDIVFNVKDTGEVSITGNTNYEQFKGVTNELTSKERNIWSLNITSPIFDKYTYLIKLPKYSVMNYIKANNKFVIGEKDGFLAVSGSGEDKPLNVFIEYSIDKEDSYSNTVITITGLVLLLIIIGFFFAFKRKKTVKQKHKESKIKRELYTERQLKILDYLQKHGSVTQSELEKELNLPKSSLSRNIRTLVQKGVIFSETKGMSNIIGLK